MQRYDGYGQSRQHGGNHHETYANGTTREHSDIHGLNAQPMEVNKAVTRAPPFLTVL
jgi:hypothetical protein